MAGRRHRKFIKRAIKRPGTLRAKAKREGLIKGDEGLSEKDLAKMAAHGDTRTKRQVNLARTLKKMRRRKRRAA